MSYDEYVYLEIRSGYNEYSKSTAHYRVML